MEYSQLSASAKMHIDAKALPSKLAFSTPKQALIKAYLLIALVPLIASIAMFISLSGTEQIFYGVSTLLLMTMMAGLFALNHQLVLDLDNRRRYLALTLLGQTLKLSEQASLNDTELLIRHSPHKSELFELKVHSYFYPVGSRADTLKALFYLSKICNLAAKEQISQYPAILPLNPLSDEPWQLPKTDSINCSSAEQTRLPSAPTWRVANIAKLGLPLPIFLLIGAFIATFTGQ